MNEIKVRGIVLREEAMGDKDKRVVLLTEELGRISVLAKGAKSVKSKVGALTQPFCLSDYVLQKGRTFYYIKEAHLVESFYELREDLERLAYATLMAEVAETLTLEGTENTEQVRLFLRSLVYQKQSEEKKASLWADVFIFRLLADSGFYPELTRCRKCGRSLEILEEGEEVIFDASNGSIFCRNCRKYGPSLHSGSLRALRYIASAPLNKLFAFTVNEEVLSEMDQAVSLYLLEQTERRYRGLEFLAELKNAEKK